MTYKVVLKRHEHTQRPDVCVFYDEDRETAIKAMKRYVEHNGFTIHEDDGWFTVADILLVEQERYVGAPVISVKRYNEIFDIDGKRRKVA